MKFNTFSSGPGILTKKTFSKDLPHLKGEGFVTYNSRGFLIYHNKQFHISWVRLSMVYSLNDNSCFRAWQVKICIFNFRLSDTTQTIYKIL